MAWNWGNWLLGRTSTRTTTIIHQSAAALPRNLKRLREARGWRVSDLARATQASSRVKESVNAGTIRQIERGRHDCLLTTALNLASALGVGVEALVEEGHEPLRGGAAHL
jgi:transcriptional regulator with XRE-family HTH domain